MPGSSHFVGAHNFQRALESHKNFVAFANPSVTLYNPHYTFIRETASSGLNTNLVRSPRCRPLGGMGMLVGERKGRQPINGVLLNCSCGQLCFMPLGTLGNRAIYPQKEGARACVPQIPSVIAGASPQAQMQILALRTGMMLLRPRDRGRMGTTTTHSRLHIWDGNAVPIF